MREDCNIDYMIRKNVMTCSNYYRHRINALKQMISQDKTFFGSRVYYYFITEFQTRGSEHEHGFL